MMQQYYLFITSFIIYLVQRKRADVKLEQLVKIFFLHNVCLKFLLK